MSSMETKIDDQRIGPSGSSLSYSLWSFSSLLADYYHNPIRFKSTAYGEGEEEDDDGQTVRNLPSIPKCHSSTRNSVTEGVPLPDPMQLQNNETGEKKNSREKKRDAAGDWIALLLRLPFDCYCRHSQSLILENIISVARDHLANERTYLAWLRTSLSMITVGAAITQLYRTGEVSHHSTHPEFGRALGILFIGASLLFLYVGSARYFHAQHAMCKGYFPATRGSVVMATMAVFAMLLAMCVILILERDAY